MTTTRIPLADPTDLSDRRLAEECLTWHAANCAMCTTGTTCGAAAENLAFLTGTELIQAVTIPAPSQANRPTTAGTGTGRQARPASEKQVRFLASLLEGRDYSAATVLQTSVVTRAAAALKAGNLASRQASDAIDILTQCPRVTPVAPVAAKAARTAQQAPRVELEAGMYSTPDGRIFKVYRGRESGRMLAKILVEDGADSHLEYAGAASRVVPADAVRMTLEEAKAFGRRTGICCCCGALLTDPRSIADGLGPICSGRV